MREDNLPKIKVEAELEPWPKTTELQVQRLVSRKENSETLAPGGISVQSRERSLVHGTVGKKKKS